MYASIRANLSVISLSCSKKDMIISDIFLGSLEIYDYPEHLFHCPLSTVDVGISILGFSEKQYHLILNVTVTKTGK